MSAKKQPKPNNPTNLPETVVVFRHYEDETDNWLEVNETMHNAAATGEDKIIGVYKLVSIETIRLHVKNTLTRKKLK